MKHQTNHHSAAGTVRHQWRRLRVIMRLITELVLDPKNPRVHRPQQIRQIARSIDAFGFLIPVLIDPHRRVIAGHGRVLAAQQLGLRGVPTICVTHLNETQRRAFMIADNKLCENALWNEQVLTQHFKELAALDLDFSLDVTGFEMGEIDLMIEGAAPAPSNADDPADVLPASGPAVSQAGDLWFLDRHRLLCGNALDDAMYRLLMKGKKAAMVFTDPPYNVPIDGHVSGLGQTTHREFPMAVGELSKEEFAAFLTQVCRLLARFASQGSLCYIFMDWRSMDALLAAGCAAFTELKNVCVWDKGTGGMGSFYRSQHELVFVFKSGRGAHRNNVQLGQFGRNRTNIWNYPGANAFGRTSEEGNVLALHPTVKPVALVADAILDASARNDIILDPFLGSGTTLMAAERVGRICYGLELDPLYVDTAIRRWQRWTGQSARHATTGKLFTELEAEKGGRNGN